MTRKEALAELISKVEAGTVRADHRRAKWQDCDFEQVGYGYRVNVNIAKAYNGSLDAAKALHDAVLPGWQASVDAVPRSDGFVAVWLSENLNRNKDARMSDCREYGIFPARAWLLAILRALHSIDTNPDHSDWNAAIEAAIDEIDCGCDGLCLYPHACPKEDVKSIRALKKVSPNE